MKIRSQKSQAGSRKKLKLAGVFAGLAAFLLCLSTMFIWACSEKSPSASYANLRNSHNSLLEPSEVTKYDSSVAYAPSPAPANSPMNPSGSNTYSGVTTSSGGTVNIGGKATTDSSAQTTAGLRLPGVNTNTATKEELLVIGKDRMNYREWQKIKPSPVSPATQPAEARGNKPADSDPLPADAMPIPGGGTLATEIQGKLVVVPLKHTQVGAEVTGYIAAVNVKQQFTNPYKEKIEATYVFPLPENAGINEFVMTIGDRHIRGIIRERAEAEAIYKEARRQGYVASLMTQERPNIFTQHVANIEPGKAIDIEIKYFHTLAYNDGWYEWVFPMVVGPRYNPAGTTDGVGAVAHGAAGASGQNTEVQYIRPTERNGHDIGLSVTVDAGMKITEMLSLNHQSHRSVDPEGRAVVTIDPKDSIPNKDFVLRWKVAGNAVKSGMFVHKDKDGKGGYFTLMIVPPETLASLPRRPVEMVFVVDTSGSMNGQPIAQAKAAVQVALGKMHSDDTFQVVKFAGAADQLFPTAVPADQHHIAQAAKYVKVMEGDGGTEMLKGINAALDFPHDENRTRVVAFLTDGYIGNEAQILKALHQKLEGSRVFSFGVGSSVNRYLMDSMAVIGQGNAAYLSLNESAEPVMDAYFERISHPAMGNIQVDFGGMKVTDLYPQRIPELFVGRPIIITGRFSGEPRGEVTVRGKAGAENLRFTLGAGSHPVDNAGISTVWARMKIADLETESIYGERDVSKEIREVALAHGIMSAFTSFIAVDSSRRTEGDHGTSVAVPVPVPEGVRYDTTVNEGKQN